MPPSTPSMSFSAVIRQEQEQFYLPSIDDIFTPYVNRAVTYHPQSNMHDLLCAEWLDGELKQRSPERVVALYKLRIFSWVSSCFPACRDERRLRLIAEFFLFIVYLDDVTDKLSESQLVRLVDGMKKQQYVGESQLAADEFDDPTGLINLTKILWNRFREDTTESFQQHLKSTLTDFMASLITQAGNRDRTTILDLPSQMLARRRESGLPMYATLIEYAQGIEFPDAVLAHPTIIALTNAASDLIDWSNDIVSYKKERAAGDDNSNLITTLMINYGKSLQEAVDFVADLCRSSAYMIKRQTHNVPSFGDAETDAVLAVYVHGIQDLVVGFCQGFYLIERYLGKDGPKMKNGGIVKLSPTKLTI